MKNIILFLKLQLLIVGVACYYSADGQNLLNPKLHLATEYRDIGLAYQCFLPSHYVDIKVANHYFISEMMNKQISGVYRFQQNFFSISCEHFGYSKFGELKTSIGYARTLGPHFAVGLQCYYLLNHAMHYRTKHSFTFDVSFLTIVNHNIGFAFRLYNPARLHYEVVGEVPIPIRSVLSLYYQINKQLILTSFISKELPGYLDISGGAIYCYRFFAMQLLLSCRKINFTASFQWRKLLFSSVTEYHYHTGFSQALKISYVHF